MRTVNLTSLSGIERYFKIIPEKNIFLPLIIVCIVLFTVSSCLQRDKRVGDSFEASEAESDIPEISELREIFYDTHSPIEAHRLFNRINLIFDPSILNPVNNIEKYTSSNKMALNLGVYGVDMSFCNMFGQAQESINYLNNITRLSENLGISGEFIDVIEDIIEMPVTEPDSLLEIARTIYLNADLQLRETGRSSAASLILAGGWVEAMYVLCMFYEYDKSDHLIAEQIISQKYSLERLIVGLSNHIDDESGRMLLLQLKQLKQFYTDVDIMFEKGDLEIDTLNQTIKSENPVFHYDDYGLGRISELVQLIRKEIIF